MSSSVQRLEDPDFPGIAYRTGASGIPAPVLRGTGLRVESIVIDAQHWGMTPAQIANEYDLSEDRIQEAMAFYKAHHQEIDALIKLNIQLSSGEIDE